MTFDERLEFLFKSTESLHASTQELHATAQEHTRQLQQDGAHILAIAEAVQRLARIAESHEHRISDLEGENDRG